VPDNLNLIFRVHLPRNDFLKLRNRKQRRRPIVFVHLFYPFTTAMMLSMTWTELDPLCWVQIFIDAFGGDAHKVRANLLLVPCQLCLKSLVEGIVIIRQ